MSRFLKAIEDLAKTDSLYDPVSSDSGNFSRGIKGALAQGVATAKGALAATTDNEALLIEAQNDLQDNSRFYAGDVENVLDVDSLGSAAAWASNAAGNAAGSLVTTLAGGGVGGFAAKSLAKKVGAEALKKYSEKQLKQLATSKARGQLIGSSAGMMAGTFPQQMGDTALKIYQETGDINAGAAAVTGALQASLDILPVMREFRKFGMAGKIQEEITKKVLKSPTKIRQLAGSMGKTMGFEGATEVGQDALGLVALEVLNEQKDHFTVTEFRGLINSFAAGAVGGATLGAPSAMRDVMRSDAPWFKQYEKRQDDLKKAAVDAAGNGDEETYQLKKEEMVANTEAAQQRYFSENASDAEMKQGFKDAGRQMEAADVTGNEAEQNALSQQYAGMQDEQRAIFDSRNEQARVDLYRENPEAFAHWDKEKLDALEAQAGDKFKQEAMSILASSGNQQAADERLQMFEALKATRRGFDPQHEATIPDPVTANTAPDLYDGYVPKQTDEQLQAVEDDQQSAMQQEYLAQQENNALAAEDMAGLRFPDEVAAGDAGVNQNIPDSVDFSPQASEGVSNGRSVDSNSEARGVGRSDNEESRTYKTKTARRVDLYRENPEAFAHWDKEKLDALEAQAGERFKQEAMSILASSGNQQAADERLQMFETLKAKRLLYQRDNTAKQFNVMQEYDPKNRKDLVEELNRAQVDLNLMSYGNRPRYFKNSREARKRLEYLEAFKEKFPPRSRNKAATPVDDLGQNIEQAANEAATSPKNDLPEPTDAQKEAGNYKVGKIKLHGLDISIENPKGSERTGVDDAGKRWSNKIHSDYGYIKGTVGADKDHLDVFVGDDATNEQGDVFVIDQINPDKNTFDEHKIMLGFGNEDNAVAKYLENYDKGWQGVGAVSRLSVDEFKQWVDSGKTTKPLRWKEKSKGSAVKPQEDRSLIESSSADIKPIPDNKSAAVSSRKNSPVDIERVVIPYTLGELNNHPDYEAAKAGDLQAAVRVANDLVTKEVADSVRDLMSGDTLIIPVFAEEGQGRNKIPLAIALQLEKQTDHVIVRDVVQTNKVARTHLKGLDRIFASPSFDGGDLQGGEFLLVDDTVTQGATFAAMSAHINKSGGSVVGALALTGKQYSARLKPIKQTLDKLYNKYGTLEDDFKTATGYGFDSLTQSEARYLANYKPTNAVRTRILKERDARIRDRDAPPNGDVKRSETKTNSDNQAPPSEGLGRSGDVEVENNESDLNQQEADQLRGLAGMDKNTEDLPELKQLDVGDDKAASDLVDILTKC